MSLSIRIYNAEGEAQAFDADFVTLINEATFGKPPLITAEHDGDAPARPGSTVLFINTRLVPYFEIDK